MTVWMPETHVRETGHPEPERVASPPPVLKPIPKHSLALGLALSDLVMVVAAFWAGHLLRDAVLAAASGWRVSLAALGVAAAAVVVFGLHGLYEPRTASRGWHQLALMMRSWLVLIGFVVLAIFLVKADAPLRSRLALLYFFLIGAAGTALLRVGVWRPLLRHTLGLELRGARVIVGTGRLARRAAAVASRLDPVLVGFVDDVEAPGSSRTSRPEELPAPLLGGLEEVRRLAREQRISEVLVAREDLSRGRLVELGHEWLDEGLRVSLVSSAFEVMVARASGGLLGGVPLAELKRSPQRGWGLKLKRLLDVSAVVLGGIPLLPLLGAVALAIRFSSPGSVLYRQERVGRKGKPFLLYKFRSMVVNNDDGVHRRYVEALMHGGAASVDDNGRKIYKLADDPRITPLGRFLRRTSLDELPQLWNVLVGDMSLVGPRPCLPYEWDLYEDWQRHRLDVLPGITGLWQVAARSQVTFEEMVLLDLHYITNWSLGLDLTLLARTVPVVLSGSGGH
jgi:exopolysaccharide biosynthesis polyprenyl glycosylphosphotransferase